MTIEEAKSEIPDIDTFCKEACNRCSSNDWYCPSYCTTLIMARNMDFERIQKSYARNDGEMGKVMRYIKRAKV